MPVIYSTASCDIDYVAYAPGRPTDASSKVNKRIRIKGGANIAPLKGQLITPYGAATVITDKDLEFLESNESFKRHESKGFMKVDKGSNKPKNADDVAKACMTAKDRSAPMTKDTISQHCGESTSSIKAVVEPTESSKERMK